MFSLNLRYTGFPPSKRDYNNAVKEVLAETALRWHERFFEDHFTETGASKYGYLKRKGELQRGNKGFKNSYVGRKLRKLGANRPLYWSGEAYRESKVPKVRSTSKESRVILSRIFNWKHPKSQIKMRDEVTRVLPAEQEELIEYTGRRLDKKIAAFK